MMAQANLGAAAAPRGSIPVLHARAAAEAPREGVRLWSEESRDRCTGPGPESGHSVERWRGLWRTT